MALGFLLSLSGEEPGEMTRVAVLCANHMVGKLPVEPVAVVLVKAKH